MTYMKAAPVEFMTEGLNLVNNSLLVTLSCVHHVLVQTTPALTAAAHELLQRFPPKDCKTPVEVSHRLLSPRGGRGLRSPGRVSDRSASHAAACSQSQWLYACSMRSFHTYIHACTMWTVHLLSFVQCGVYLGLFDYILLNCLNLKACTETTPGTLHFQIFSG